MPQKLAVGLCLERPMLAPTLADQIRRFDLSQTNTSHRTPAPVLLFLVAIIVRSYSAAYDQ
jgi:hypothetical protein